MARPVGNTHKTIPVPPVPEHTTYWEVGGVKIGLEGRFLTGAILADHFSKDPEQARIFAELAAKSTTNQATLDDVGISIHVFDARDDKEYVRFDMFDGDPHYHYMTPGSHHIPVIFVTTANPDYIGWTFERLATSLPAMMEKAGAADAARHVDMAAVRAILPELRAAADNALASQRAEHVAIA